MQKLEFEKELASRTEITQKKAGDVLDAIIAIVIEKLKEDEPVQLTGFGTFKTEMRAERECRNPQTGESIKIPAKKVAKFVIGKTLKDAMK